MSAIEERVIIREHLLVSGTDLAVLCGDRIFTPHLAIDFDNSQAGIEFDIRDGRPIALGVMQSVDVEFRCFGGGTGARKEVQPALDVYHALVNRFMNASGQYDSMIQTASGMIVNCAEESRGTVEQYPVDEWPVVICAWNFEIRNN